MGRARLPLAAGVPTRTLPSVMSSVPRGTKTQRLRSSIRNDNHGQWFVAESRWSAAELERRFRWGLVARCLYERVGGLLQGPSPYIYIQIALVTDVIDHIDPISHEEVWKQVRSYGYRMKSPYDHTTGRNFDDEMWPEWCVEVSLREVHIELVGPIDIHDILTSGHY